MDVDDPIARWRREKREQQARARALHFASGDPIPDLDLMPPCPICGGYLTYDEAFICSGCDVEWDRSGCGGVRSIPDELDQAAVER